MNERIEKYKFRRWLRKIDWDSVIKATKHLLLRSSKRAEGTD